MKARRVILKRKKEVSPPEPKSHLPQRGRPPKKKPAGTITINRFSPADYWKRFQLAPTDSNYLDPRSVKPDIRQMIIYWAENVAYIPRYEILTTLNLPLGTYYSDCKQMRDRTFNLIDESAVEKIARDLINSADQLSNEALKCGKPRDAWLIRKECLETLQSLGVTIKKPEEHKIIEEWDFPGLMTGTAELEKTTKVVVHNNGNGNGKSRGKD